MTARTTTITLCTAFWLGLASVPAASAEADEIDEAAAPDLLAVLGYRVTEGAAPGYVADRACAVCHGEIWASYREVGMARSLYRPRPEDAVEAFGEIFEHALSRRRYRLRFEGERLIFRRDQRGPGGQPINVFEHEVAWILGSGNHSRVYLIRQPSGELLQLPIAWYAADAAGAPARWGMAPGFDSADHLGLGRRVRRECMFCHNAYPQVPEGSDILGAAQTFPAELPEGTGCQRCHGPGAEHARLAFGGARDREAVRAAIVNPGRLEPARRDDICFGCHLQPSVAIPAVRRAGRGDYSFRPGEDLASYQVQVEAGKVSETRDDRFEINHHPYRLRQSRCFQASDGALSCLSCHDPHRKVPVAERAAHYRAACQQCHKADACTRPAHATRSAGGEAVTDTGGCVACHMPPRRPTDVVQVVMTDHRISRRFDAEAYLAPRDEREPEITDIGFYWPDRAPTGAHGEMYRSIAVLRIGSSEPATDHLSTQLTSGILDSDAARIAWRELGRAALALGRNRTAIYALDHTLTASPDDAQARMWAGLARQGVGDLDDALQLLEHAAASELAPPEAWYNLGQAYLKRERTGDARAALGRATAARPTFARAWLALGRAHTLAGDGRAAIDALRRALAVDPRLMNAYPLLAEALEKAGQPDEAKRYRRHAAAMAGD